MPAFQSLPLALSEAQQAELLQLYRTYQQQLEQRHFPEGQMLDKLRTAMRAALDRLPGFEDLHREAALQHTVLHLTHADNRLLNLPWRLAVTDRDRLYLTVGNRAAAAAFSPQNAAPLKILVMVAAPEGPGTGARLDYETEEQQIIRAFSPLFANGNIDIDFTDDGSLESLRAKLQANRYHILHVSGHGVYDAEGLLGEKKPNTGYLQLEDERTLGPRLVSALDFARVLNEQEKHRPDLVLLSSCQTAQGSGEAGFEGVSNKLLDAGIPAVVAMAFSIIDQFATAFAAKLYGELAVKKPLAQAFQAALAHVRTQEAPTAQQRQGQPGQWLIPQLCLGQAVDELVNWTAPAQQLVFQSAKLATGEQRILLEARPGYLFIGRRRERRDALRHLEGEGRAVLLRGMGGVGKTALAEHLLGRLAAHDPKVFPFVVNEKDQSSLEALMKQMKDYLQKHQRQFTIHTETAKYDKALDQLAFLLDKLNAVCTPVFLFDNLESFQDGPGGAFKPEHSDLLETLQLLVSVQAFPLILTGRYPLLEFPDLPVVDLNSVGYGDFYKKCRQLSFASLLRQPLSSPKRTNDAPVTFDDLVALLHPTLGGNYRALEFFDELFQARRSEILPTLDKLDAFRRQLSEDLALAVRERLNSSARALIFEELYGLLSPAEQQALHLLAGFRVPVLALALELQGLEAPLPALARLHALTLIEREQMPTEGEALELFYVAPLVRDFLERQAAQAEFSHAKAGEYFEYVDREINHQTYADLEEAFWHCLQAQAREKGSSIGTQLCSMYYDKQLFSKSFFYGKAAEELLGEETEGLIWNVLGIIYQIFGRLDQALHYQQKYLSYAREQKNRAWEGTTLNNISQIYDARGDYETALAYLEQSLRIQREIGDKAGEGATLNNLATTAHARGDYETALAYLEQSLRMQREIGDTAGMIPTLHNMAQIAWQAQDVEKYMQYEVEALQLARQTGNAAGIFHVGKDLGLKLYRNGDKEKGLALLVQAYEAGSKAGFPQAVQLGQLLASLRGA